MDNRKRESHEKRQVLSVRMRTEIKEEQKQKENKTWKNRRIVQIQRSINGKCWCKLN